MEGMFRQVTIACHPEAQTGEVGSDSTTFLVSTITKPKGNGSTKVNQLPVKLRRFLLRHREILQEDRELRKGAAQRTQWQIRNKKAPKGIQG